ncbi:MAG TPA: hypothetical protein VI818_06400 [Candidatus Thermoplasmatota archaeon]|nr:hypothetical protein [Candidatus Thermoplasmatota archaeon]
MVVRKLSVSVSGELEAALRGLATERDEDVSPLVETLLREHWLLATRIQRARETERDDAALLAQTARRLWADRTASGDLRRADDGRPS